MARLDKVGFEIEGGWDGTPRISPFSDIALIADHSINGQSLGNAPAIAAAHVGEAVSPPLALEDGKWEEWLTIHWPNAEPRHRTNRTCGFHIHVSTKSLKDYTLLTSKSFLFALRVKMEEVGKAVKLPKKHIFWERMGGFNRFCELDFEAAQQMRVRRKGGNNRYGWLNFAWEMHGTMEFRALPTFRDAKVGVRFAKEYLDFIESWLEAQGDKQLIKSARLVE